MRNVYSWHDFSQVGGITDYNQSTGNNGLINEKKKISIQLSQAHAATGFVVLFYIDIFLKKLLYLQFLNLLPKNCPANSKKVHWHIYITHLR